MEGSAKVFSCGTLFLSPTQNIDLIHNCMCQCMTVYICVFSKQVKKVSW